MPANAPHLPLLPHRAAGVDCTGFIVPEISGDQVTLRCNVCGGVVGTINAGILKAMDQAIADSFVIQKFNELHAPRVLTSISEECQRGECERCPGHFYRPESGYEPVFCIHECHK